MQNIYCLKLTMNLEVVSEGGQSHGWYTAEVKWVEGF